MRSLLAKHIKIYHKRLWHTKRAKDVVCILRDIAKKYPKN